MKLAPQNHQTSGSRTSQSLQVRNAVPGKKEVMPGKTGTRDILIKAPQNVMKLKRSSINQSKNIPRRSVQKNVNGAMRLSRAFTNEVKSVNSLNGTFLRPPIDIISARNKVVERALRLAEANKECNSTPKQVVKSAALKCTPRQTGLARAYLKLSESKKKSAVSLKLVPPTPKSPFEGVIKHEIPGRSINGHTHPDNSVKKALSVPIIDFDGTPNQTNCTGKKGEKGTWLNSNKSTCLENVSEEKLSIHSGNEPTTCAWKNIIKHCQLYSDKISAINNAIYQLDESFEKVMVAKMDGQIQAKFGEYQKRKRELLQQMSALDVDLEEAVMSEMDVQSKFKEYLEKRDKIFKERYDVLEGFKKTVNNALHDYEERVTKPPSNNKIEDIMKTLVETVEESNKSVENVKPATGATKRTSATPRKSASCVTSPRCLRSNSVKRLKKDEFVIKKNTRSAEKRNVQRLIYKDLQENFNLCSPECSF